MNLLIAFLATIYVCILLISCLSKCSWLQTMLLLIKWDVPEIYNSAPNTSFKVTNIKAILMGFQMPVLTINAFQFQCKLSIAYIWCMSFTFPILALMNYIHLVENFQMNFNGCAFAMHSPRFWIQRRISINNYDGFE